MFHLGYFMLYGFGIQPWRGPFDGRNVDEWMKPDYYVELTSALERGGFDFVFMEDTALIEDTYGDSMEAALKHGWLGPKNDPIPLVPLMAQGSKHVGIISTVSTMQYHPFMAARQFRTLDHLTNGRVGANVVTSVAHRVAHNLGLDRMPAHDERYAMAEEWVEIVTRLWDSWEDGAVIGDQSIPMYADHTKVHPIDFKGKYFSSRGPLSTIPSPQRRPVIAQAGSSPAGRDLAARFADTMIGQANTVDEMKPFRDDMHRRLSKFGRKPEDLKILFLVTPIIGEDDAHAQLRREQRDAYEQSDEFVRWSLFNLSYMSGGDVDFGRFDLDAPLPEVVGNGQHSTMKILQKANEGKPLRELAQTRVFPDLGLIGGPETLASKMSELMDEVGGDGFLIHPFEGNRRAIYEYTDGLCPVLKRRGLIPDGYQYKTFRENFMSY